MMFFHTASRRTRWTEIALVAILAGPWCLAQSAPTAQGPAEAWMNRDLSPDRRADLVIARMTLDEKIQLVHGAGFPGLGPTDPLLERSNGGFGLSYSSFTYSQLRVTGGSALQVSFTVRNTSGRAGKEIAQVYLGFPRAANEPPKRLIGWEKIALDPGESKTVSLKVDPLYLSIFDASADRWEIVPGEYEVRVGPSSAKLPLSAAVQLNGTAAATP